jgi:orotate phosphoribosyltransferase-like protein
LPSVKWNSIQNTREIWNILSLTKNNHLEWRRNKVLELSSQGLTQSDIATELHIVQPTVAKDLKYIRKQAHDNLQYHIQETLPLEVNRAMVGINQVLRMCWSIANKAVDDRTRLQALALISECNKQKVDLSTNSGIVSEAMKYVTQTQEKINTINKIDEKLEVMEEETTTNGVF